MLDAGGRRRRELLAAGTVRQPCRRLSLDGLSPMMSEPAEASRQPARLRSKTQPPTVNATPDATLRARARVDFVNANYVFASPVLGG